MAHDNGPIADIENANVTALTAITLGGETVFRKVENWRWQITGPDAWRKFCPFAFVKYAGTPNTNPEGDHDLNQHLTFSILVGTDISGDADAARIGRGVTPPRHLGVSRMRDLVITALQEQVPATTSGDVEYFEFLGDSIEWDERNRYAISMRFRIDRVGAYNP